MGYVTGVRQTCHDTGSSTTDLLQLSYFALSLSELAVVVE
jgi:hypothetical protein